MNIYLKEDDMTDIDKLDEYNAEYTSVYPDFIPSITKENYKEELDHVNKVREGIDNEGIKEIYYWVIEGNKIVGHASIRLNPEINPSTLKYAGHIMYGVVPSKRGKGYGSLICHLLLEKLDILGYSEVIITCSEDNIGSIKVIENNNGKLIETVDPDGKNTTKKTNRYVVDIKESLKHFEYIHNNITKN